MRPLRRCAALALSRSTPTTPPMVRLVHQGNTESSSSTPGESVFVTPLFTMGRGSTYYFPGPADSPPAAPAAREAPQGQRSSAGSISLERACVPTEQRRAGGVVTYVKSAFRTISVDTSTPPVTAEELLHWRLDRYLYTEKQLTHFFPNAKEPLFLLPPHAMVTSLGPDMDAVDRVFRQKGLFTPSEIAEVFFAVVPTFYVESTHAFKALPSNLAFRLDSLIPRGLWVSVLLSRYPMLFELRRPRFQKSVVKLNSKLWFVRAHPLYGSADRLMQPHNAEFKAHGGGRMHLHAPTGDREKQRGAIGSISEKERQQQMDTADDPSPDDHHQRAERKPLDLQIFDILVDHLPRAAGNSGDEKNAEPDQRYAALPLVDWINSFSPEELDVLNMVPQDRVLAVMGRYTRVFQLMTRLPSSETEERGRLRGVMDAFASQSLFIDQCELVPHIGVRSDVVEGKADAALPAKSTTVARVSPVTQPEEMMREALQDDIVGFNDLVAEHVQTSSRGGDDNAAELRDLSGEDGVVVGLKAKDEEREADGAALEDVDASEPAAEMPPRAKGEPISMEEGAEQEDELDSAVSDLDSVNDQGFGGNLDASALNLDAVYVRRLPPNVAPRSLSNFNEYTSPCAPLVRFAASFLNPPPSLASVMGEGKEKRVRGGRDAVVRREQQERTTLFACPDTAARRTTGGNAAVAAAPSWESARGPLAAKPAPAPPQPPADGLWRWVSITRIYSAMAREQQHLVRREFKGLVNFLRLHGELFEVNEDYTHVIAHDPGGVIAPLVPSQKHFRFEERVVLPRSFDEDDRASASLLGEEERRKFADVLGHSQLPTTRRQLVLLDPNNPLLHHEVFEDEMAELVPPRTPISRTELMRHLPPLMKAVVPSNFTLASNKRLVTWTENGTQMVQRRELGRPAVLDEPLMKAEEAVEALRAAIPMGGATVRALVRMHLSAGTVRSLEHHYGSVAAALSAFPHYFHVTESSAGSRADALVELISL